MNKIIAIIMLLCFGLAVAVATLCFGLTMATAAETTKSGPISTNAVVSAQVDQRLNIQQDIQFLLDVAVKNGNAEKARMLLQLREDLIKVLSAPMVKTPEKSTYYAQISSWWKGTK